MGGARVLIFVRRYGVWRRRVVFDASAMATISLILNIGIEDAVDGGHSTRI